MSNWISVARLSWLLVLSSVVLGPGSALQAQKAGAASKPASRSKVPSAADVKSVETLTASALKSMVVVSHFGRDGKEDGVGAGFVVDPTGLIATSLHVIGEARPIGVRLPDGKVHEV